MKDEGQLLIEDIRMLLRSIQASRKGSFGGMHNTYIAQLDRRRVDDIATQLERISRDGLTSQGHIRIVRDGKPIAWA